MRNKEDKKTSQKNERIDMIENLLAELDVVLETWQAPTPIDKIRLQSIVTAAKISAKQSKNLELPLKERRRFVSYFHTSRRKVCEEAIKRCKLNLFLDTTYGHFLKVNNEPYYALYNNEPIGRDLKPFWTELEEIERNIKLQN